MGEKKLVPTQIRITDTQREFLHNSDYCLSKVVRNTITKLMEAETSAI